CARSSDYGAIRLNRFDVW
nr:immunoglobulin heavy chain junction region [Macaca mulatta]